MIGRSSALIPVLVLATTLRTSLGNDPSTSAFFEQRIRPLFSAHCFQCHSTAAAKVRGGLLLDSKAGWQKGGESGLPAIIPGRPDDSPLIKYVRHEGGLAMPPDKRLSESMISDLVAWIRAGAADPRIGVAVATNRADSSWWSLQPLRKVQSPYDSTNDRPIDGFIAAKLSEQRLSLNPPADARTLIRRMNYDVIGLPPTPDEVESFTAVYTASPEAAVENLVDRLLSSPHYGERWGRHWLDVIRFGESNGFERNFLIDDLWPFRDYVISSLNSDKPYDQFVVEHLAGDVVGPDSPAVEIGSAFLVAGPFDDVGNQDVVAQANIRAATLDEVITSTASAFLGLTINCARCHHHKFDPIPSEDYYRLRAAFEGIEHGRRVVASSAERESFAAQMAPLNERKQSLNEKLESLEAHIEARAKDVASKGVFSRPKVDPQRTEERFPAQEAKYVKFVVHALTNSPRRLTVANPRRVGTRGSGRLTEFEVWTTGPNTRNVALASNGARVQGAKSAVAEDFPDAYGPHLAIDGQFGEQWFIGEPAELTVTLPQVQMVDRIVFSNAKGLNLQDRAQGATPCEYDVLVSLDGTQWRTVASSDDREPWTASHAVERVRASVITESEKHEIEKLEQELTDLDSQIRSVKPLPQIWVGNHRQSPPETRLHHGGDPTRPGEVVVPASLNVLAAVTQPFELPADSPTSQRRLSLAQWIVSNSNPLTARVIVNRLWHYHFGTGIVDTPNDFGSLGGKPTHPELLDWLACELVGNGWRLKPIHREILLSHVYRQSSFHRTDAAAIDKNSRLLWRFPPRRLSAEELRDTFLAVSGVLRSENRSWPAAPFACGGPGFRLYRHTQNNVSTYFPLDRHGPDTYRRAVYHQSARASVVDLLSDFDLPDTAFSAPRRASTTTPLQALTLLNHSFTADMSSALSDRIVRQGTTEPRAIVDHMFQLVLQRSPTPNERDAAEQLLAAYGPAILARALLNLSEVLYVD